MAKLTFGSSEFRKLTGISAETLRHYTGKGVLGGVEVAPNGYRRYDARSVIDALEARTCRGLDLGLSQIVHNHDYALDGQETLLHRHEEALKAEALELDLKLARVRQMAECLHFAREHLGQVVERPADSVPALYRLMLLSGEEPGGHACAPNASRITESWMAHPQYVHVAIRVRREALLAAGSEDLPVDIGIGVRSEYASLLKLDMRPPAEFFPSERNVGTVVALADPLRLRRSDVSRLLEKADALGYRIASDLIGRLCASIATERGRVYYFTACICIK